MLKLAWALTGRWIALRRQLRLPLHFGLPFTFPLSLASRETGSRLGGLKWVRFIPRVRETSDGPTRLQTWDHSFRNSCRCFTCCFANRYKEEIIAFQDGCRR
jgi:hypothetical protein